MSESIPVVMAADLRNAAEKMTRREKNLRKAVLRAIDASSLKEAREILTEAMNITPQELSEKEAAEKEAKK